MEFIDDTGETMTEQEAMDILGVQCKPSTMPSPKPPVDVPPDELPKYYILFIARTGQHEYEGLISSGDDIQNFFDEYRGHVRYWAQMNNKPMEFYAIRINEIINLTIRQIQVGPNDVLRGGFFDNESEMHDAIVKEFGLIIDATARESVEGACTSNPIIVPEPPLSNHIMHARRES
ncbi:MAG: hypothetical protein ACW96M_08540, partial [Candidatus Thorarchaeota archaeon]